MKVRVRGIRLLTLPMATRFPFQYGIASMTALPHVVALVDAEVGGRPVRGISAEGMAPKWFTKNPATVFEDDDLPEMRRSIRHAAAVAGGTGERASFFAFWRDLYEGQSEWAKAEGVPGLLANLGTALVERAVLDAVCRAAGVPISEALRGGLAGIDPGAIHDELRGMKVADVLPERPRPRLAVRHTVGLGDPLTRADVAEGEEVDDGLPLTLVETIRAYGIAYFKIKLSGSFERDRDRLLALARIFAEEVGAGARFTMDGNEQYRDVASFRDHWERLLGVPEIAKFVREGLLLVEQPLHRDDALVDRVRTELSEWKGAPPLIIDESDATLASAPRAFDLGYAGLSHKNCKGVVKGIANAALAAKRGRLLTAEDLANVGPVALLQDLAMAAALGIAHVERNGHHYFKGLSMWPDEVGAAVLRGHGDLYARHPGGFPSLAIEEGAVRLASVNGAAGFAVSEEVVAAVERCGLEEWGA